MNKLIITLMLLVPMNLLSQVLIKGLVVDSIDQNPLPYTTIYIEGTQTGTISNSEGVFEFMLSPEQINKAFILSYVGYEKKKIRIDTHTKNFKVFMQKSISKIVEVQVNGYKKLANTDSLNRYIAGLLLKVKRELIKERQKHIEAKSFAKIFSKKNDIHSVELFEAFYSSKINKFEVSQNVFKSGKVKLVSLDRASIYSLDIFSYFMKQINFLFPIISSKNIYNIKNTKIDISNPLINKTRKQITDQYSLTVYDIGNNLLKVSYKMKANNNINGDFIIDTEELKLLNISVNSPYYGRNVPLRFVDKTYQIDSLSLNYNISYTDKKHPHLFKLNLQYYYTDSFNIVNKIETKAEQFIYQMNSKFESPNYNIPYKFFKGDYNLASITPVNHHLWELEPKIIKNKEEFDFKGNEAPILDFGYKLELERWHPNWNLNNLRINRLDSILIDYQIETLIYYDVYTVNEINYVETAAYFDYNSSILDSIPNDEFCKTIFDLTQNYAIQLKVKLQEEKDISNYKAIYENTWKAFLKEKTFLKEEKYLKENYIFSDSIPLTKIITIESEINKKSIIKKYKE